MRRLVLIRGDFSVMTGRCKGMLYPQPCWPRSSSQHWWEWVSRDVASRNPARPRPLPVESWPARGARLKRLMSPTWCKRQNAAKPSGRVDTRKQRAASGWCTWSVRWSVRACIPIRAPRAADLMARPGSPSPSRIPSGAAGRSGTRSRPRRPLSRLRTRKAPDTHDPVLM